MDLLEVLRLSGVLHYLNFPSKPSTSAPLPFPSSTVHTSSYIWETQIQLMISYSISHIIPKSIVCAVNQFKNWCLQLFLGFCFCFFFQMKKLRTKIADWPTQGDCGAAEMSFLVLVTELLGFLTALRLRNQSDTTDNPIHTALPHPHNVISYHRFQGPFYHPLLWDTPGKAPIMSSYC